MNTQDTTQKSEESSSPAVGTDPYGSVGGQFETGRLLAFLVVAVLVILGAVLLSRI